MRLINVFSMQMQEFVAKIPPYAILSHRWSDDEITLEEYKSNSRLDSIGYGKVKEFCDFVRQLHPSPPYRKYLGSEHEHEWANDLGGDEEEACPRWVWVDTCCIDQKSSAELSEAINSMFTWYWKASFCVAYLVDIPELITRPPGKANWLFDHLETSPWFRRGWTLQELLAPRTVIFCNEVWEEIGRKDEVTASHSVNFLRQDFLGVLSAVTMIPRGYIARRSTIQHACFAEKVSWAAKRRTSRPEDLAYALLGLLDVNMPLLYGEGPIKAFRRLQQQFIQQSDDESIFVWCHQSHRAEDTHTGVLAASPRDFLMSGSFRTIQPTDPDYTPRQPYSITNKGLSLETPTCTLQKEDYKHRGMDCLSKNGIRDVGIPTIVIDRELPPGPCYAIPLNCRMLAGGTRRDDRFVCELGVSGTLRGAGAGHHDFRVGYVGEKCFLFLREHSDGMAVVETSQYLFDPDNSDPPSFECDGHPRPRHFFVKLRGPLAISDKFDKPWSRKNSS